MTSTVGEDSEEFIPLSEEEEVDRPELAGDGQQQPNREWESPSLVALVGSAVAFVLIIFATLPRLGADTSGQVSGGSAGTVATRPLITGSDIGKITEGECLDQVYFFSSVQPPKVSVVPCASDAARTEVISTMMKQIEADKYCRQGKRYTIPRFADSNPDNVICLETKVHPGQCVPVVYFFSGRIVADPAYASSCSERMERPRMSAQERVSGAYYLGRLIVLNPAICGPEELWWNVRDVRGASDKLCLGPAR